MSKESMELLEEVRQTNRLLALQLTKGLKQAEAIRELGRAGLQAKDIAEILGTTRNTVSVALSNMKKRNSRSTQKRSKNKN